MKVSQNPNRTLPKQVSRESLRFRRLDESAHKAAERFIAVAIPKNDPSMANDASETVTGHVFESVKFEDSADILAGNIGESKHGPERSQKHLYKNIEAKEGRAILGNVYVDGFAEKFLEKKK